MALIGCQINRSYFHSRSEGCTCFGYSLMLIKLLSVWKSACLSHPACSQIIIVLNWPPNKNCNDNLRFRVLYASQSSFRGIIHMHSLADPPWQVGKGKHSGWCAWKLDELLWLNNWRPFSPHREQRFRVKCGGCSSQVSDALSGHYLLYFLHPAWRCFCYSLVFRWRKQKHT